MKGTRLGRLLDAIEGVARSPWGRLAVFSVIALASVWPLFAGAGSLNEFRDAHVLGAYEHDARQSVVRFGQLPLWDPYYCGGMYALGTPQSRFAAPPFLLTLLLGSLRAQPVIAYAMLVLGMEGAFRYFRTRTGTALAPFLAAPLLALNGMFAVAYFYGWINFYGFELVPWVLFGAHLAARGDARGALVTAIAFGFIVGFGGTYAAPMAALFAVLETVRTLLERKRPLRSVWPVILAAGLLSVGVSAFRLWPVWETLASSPRIMAGTPKNDWELVSRMLFEPALARSGEHGYGGLFFSRAFALALAPLAIFVPRAIPAFVLGGLSLWAATGYLGSTPFTWLRELPIFSTFRYPERFLFFAVLFAAELAAIAAALLLRVRWNPLRLVFVLALVPLFAVSAGTLVKNQRDAVAGMQLAPPPLRVDGEFRQARGNRWLLAYYQPLSRGSLSCWEAYPVFQSTKLRGDLASEEYLAEPDAGSVERVAWSPNRIDVRTDLARPARLIVNQNWHPGWRSSEGSVVSHEGLLAVDLPSGAATVTLRFLPRSAIGGGLISLASLVAAGALWAFRRGRLQRKSPKTWLLLGAPVFALGASLLIPEPAHPAPQYTNANGTPALVDALPAEAKPLSAKFELPVELLGARIVPAEEGRTDVELFFRVTGEVPRSVGVFAHFEAGNQIATADHLAVAASFYLGDAPRGRIVRDAFSVRLPRSRAGSWELSVGLWHAATNGARIPLEGGGDHVVVGRVENPK